jgi:hypothetical protein
MEELLFSYITVSVNLPNEARCYTAGFEGGRRAHEPDTARKETLKADNGRKTDCPLAPLGGVQPCQHLHVSAVKLISSKHAEE